MQTLLWGRVVLAWGMLNKHISLITATDLIGGVSKEQRLLVLRRRVLEHLTSLGCFDIHPSIIFAQPNHI